jgi:HPt (histidine-containing phosphotransfer) domain-containing protein/CheY-like chemotaxis protein
MSAANKSLRKSRAEQMLAALRANFIADLPKKFDDYEQLILRMKSVGDFAGQFDELFRLIHSLKGSAGTHGLQVFTNICHQFEDQLLQVDGQFEKLSPDLVNSWLSYVDLMREALDAFPAGEARGQVLDKEFTDGVQDKLDVLRQGVHSNGLTAMIVASSRSIESICRGVVENLNFNYSVMNDGYLALGRLLNEKVDVLITAKEISGLNGDALIAAIKLANNSKRPIKTILLTSEAESYSEPGRVSNPDVTILRDIHLVNNLTNALHQSMGRDS